MTGGGGALRVFEQLHGVADLASWVAGSSLARHGRLDARDVEVTLEDLVRAKALREAIRESLVAVARGRRPRRRDLESLNAAAAAPPLVPCVVRGRRAWARPMTGRQLLSTVARDGIDLITGPLAGRIRQCAAADCALVFVDTSRPGSRRWCSMERCGNRQKVRTHRARSRGADEGSA